MKLLPLVLLVAVAGCASDPEPKEAPEAVAALGAADGPTDQEKADQLDAIRFAIDNGYTIKTQDGQTLYCREDAKTGSRIKSTMTCLTPQQLKELHDRFERDLEQMRRKGLGTGPGGGGG